MDDDIHIASLIVHTHPAWVHVLHRRLTEIDDLEVRAIHPKGKIVIILEVDNEVDLVARIQGLNALRHVLAVNLVYHQSESAALLDEEIEQ